MMIQAGIRPGSGSSGSTKKAPRFGDLENFLMVGRLLAPGVIQFYFVGLYSSDPDSMKSKKSLIFFSVHPAALRSSNLSFRLSPIAFRQCYNNRVTSPGYSLKV
jgi:hypothetical protein